MALPSLRSLAMADVLADEDVRRRLVKHGENELVERKREPPKPPKLGAEAASFANTLGGWLLLGVDDERNVVGWDPGGRVDIQSHLGNRLRNEVDPLPSYLAERVELDGKGFVVVRIFEADVPVIVRGTGVIYVRDSGGKQPVTDHRIVLALASRGAGAREKAEGRLGSLPLIARVLGPPDAPEEWRAPPLEGHVRTVVRAAQHAVTPQFADWPISSRGAHACYGAAEYLSEMVYGPVSFPPSVTPHGRGVIARAQPLDASAALHPWGAIVVADSGGVIGACLTAPYSAGPGLPLHELRRDHLRPTINAVASMLRQGEAFGQAAIDLWVVVSSPVLLGGQWLPEGAMFHCGGEVVIPADEDGLHALGRRWEREIARSVGIAEWED
jgi:Putative DNA-binding domain